ncbi:hypothetical protein [Xenorhabdus kozodoii]|uniref:Uncharacterized protein n=1 Tax=Xenorhabdus kozodoii TaxID=351676 RepID=A0A2D0LCT8_9GAMM|nr:hypothetical protein [Xenorhabdus kozodoii]PHM73516.1 hypothetical protein Xkoz_01647 [Xenorhabdus kozodoii]
MDVKSIDFDLINYHARKTLRFYWDIRLCMLASRTVSSDSIEDKMESAKKCEKILEKFAFDMKINESHKIINDFISTISINRALELLGIEYNSNVDFYEYSLSFLSNIQSKKRNFDSYGFKQINDIRLLCTIVSRFAAYLAGFDLTSYFERKITFLEEYKEKLNEVLELNTHWILSSNTNEDYHNIINGDSNLNPIVIDSKINTLKNELITKRDDETKRERVLLSEIAKSLLTHKKNNITRVLTLISASPILNNYIDPRTISRIVKKTKESKEKEDNSLIHYNEIISENKNKIKELEISQRYSTLAYKRGRQYVNPLSSRRNLLIHKFKYELENL